MIDTGRLGVPLQRAGGVLVYDAATTLIRVEAYEHLRYLELLYSVNINSMRLGIRMSNNKRSRHSAHSCNSMR